MHLRVGFIAALLVGLLHPIDAGASPVPFADIVSVPGFQGLRLTLLPELTLSSADMPNFLDPSDPVYGSSAPVFVDTIPAAGGPFLGFFKMPAVDLESSLDTGTTTFLTFGPGSFSIGIFNPVVPGSPFLPFINASFEKVALAFANDGSSRFAVGDATFSGLSFAGSGLDNPGVFVLELAPPNVAFDENSPGVEYAIDLGILAAQTPATVPEPTSVLLLGSGMVGWALRVRRTTPGRRI